MDFVATEEPGGRRVHAVEVNLRKGGTTPPFTALRHLAPGRYEPDLGQWITEDGGTRCYRSSDNLVDPAWIGLAPRQVVDAVTGAGLRFDRRTGTGVVLHMLSGLAIDGRFGLTALGLSPAHALELFESARQAVSLSAGSRVGT